MSGYRVLTILLFLCSVMGQEARIIPLETEQKSEMRSMDASESVIVNGEDQEVRSRLLGMALDIRENIYKLVGLNENTQQHTLEINLYGEFGETPPERLSKKSFAVIAGRLILRLDLHLSKGVNEELLEQDLTELFLYEVSMREVDLSKEEQLAFQLPSWLSSGVLEAVRWKADKVDRQLYARLHEQQAVYPVAELLAEKVGNEDGALMNHAFRVSSGVLVMALLNQPQGKEGLLSLIEEAVMYEGEQKLLISKHFPDATLSKNSMSKWWSLQLLSMSQRPAENLYSITETERELRKLLVVEIADQDGSIQAYEPSEYLELKKYAIINSSTVVTRVINQLSLLQSKAFPAYRPLIGGYQQALLRVIQAPKKKRFWQFFKPEDEEEMSVSEMILRLEQERTILGKLGERVTDYMNWYQLEQVDAQQGSFNDYLQLKKEMENASVSDGGPISKYLDDIEKLYEKE